MLNIKIMIITEDILQIYMIALGLGMLTYLVFDLFKNFWK